MPAYTEGIPDSAWGEHWAVETGTSELSERLLMFLPVGGQVKHRAI